MPDGNTDIDFGCWFLVLLSYSTSHPMYQRHISGGTMVRVGLYNYRSRLVMVTMNNKGFTLIELMIVVAIIGVLSAIAIPAYNDYTIRAKVSEAFVVVQPYKMKFEEYFFTHGRFPTKAKNSSIGMGADGDCGPAARSGGVCAFGVNNVSKYVKNIHIGGRVIPTEDQDLIITLATIDELRDASGKRIAYRSHNRGGSIEWQCMSMVADWDSGDGTALDVDKYLPKACGEYMVQ